MPSPNMTSVVSIFDLRKCYGKSIDTPQYVSLNDHQCGISSMMKGDRGGFTFSEGVRLTLQFVRRTPCEKQWVRSCLTCSRIRLKEPPKISRRKVTITVETNTITPAITPIV